ncbi:MAG: DUF309 domain-containing protein [Anaerolineales bacterium]|nr:DUF309 domain-containing protein [Anaerolineales bacterium]
MAAVILGLLADAEVTRALTQVAGFHFKHISAGAEIEPHSERPHTPGEPLTGGGTRFIARLVEWQPALILVELHHPAIPWEAWIVALKSSPATRRIPVLAFADEVSAELTTQAEAVGCDVILNTPALLTDLSGVITRYARFRNPAISSECAQPLSTLAQEGIALHNRGEYFEAHEVLEQAWNADTSAARELYRGLLQVSVAYLQIERGNYNGALKMFLRMRQWLDPLPDVCRGVHVAQVRQDALAARAALEALGPSHIQEFNRNHFKPFIVTGGQ